MHNVAVAESPAARLINRLLRGEQPESAPLDEVPEMLAASPTGAVDARRKSEAEAALQRLMVAGLLVPIDSGQTKPRLCFPLIVGKFSPTGGLDPIARREREWESRATQGLPPLGQARRPTGKPSVHAEPIMVIRPDDLAKLKSRLIADDLWSALADQWCGINESSLSEICTASEPVQAQPLSSVPFKAFKTRVSGKFKGNLESIHRHRKDTDRLQPYGSAFNPDGSVNEPIFIAIAKSRDEWADRESPLNQVVKNWVVK